MVAISAAVLAGGSSRRMGTDKRGLVIDGIALLRRAVLTAAAISRDVMVVAPAGRMPPAALLRGLDWRPVFDRRPMAGPVAGLEAALLSARFKVLVVLPTDMPRLTPELLRLLLERLMNGHNSCAALMYHDALQPFPLTIRCEALTVVSGLLDAQQRSMNGLLRTLSTQAVLEADWRHLDAERRALLNVNAPSDVPLARIHRS